jgi:hypothetical protein
MIMLECWKKEKEHIDIHHTKRAPATATTLQGRLG